jgi:hypothetical protein
MQSIAPRMTSNLPSRTLVRTTENNPPEDERRCCQGLEDCDPRGATNIGSTIEPDDDVSSCSSQDKRAINLRRACSSTFGEPTSREHIHSGLLWRRIRLSRHLETTLPFLLVCGIFSSRHGRRLQGQRTILRAL